MNCVIYARVSTDKQAEKELSIPAQLQAMRQYVTQRNWQIVREFIEPGASAKTAERPVLRQLLADCRSDEHQIDVVLVHKIDRLARNVADHAMIRAMLQRRGIKLVSVHENLEDSVSGQLVENIMAAIAEFYSANLAEEVRKGMRQKVVSGGWPHKPPRGYVTVQNDQGAGTHVRIHSYDGPLIAKAFELFATGWYSLKTLSDRLFREGLKSSTGQRLSTSYLRALLSNPFYAGRLVWRDLNVPGRHQALVSDQMFERIQKVLSDRQRERRTLQNPQFPLRGLAMCSSCRGRMTAEQHQQFGYYRCGRQSYRRESCDARYCNAERAHEQLKNVCQQVQLHPSVSKSILTAAETVLRERLNARDEHVRLLKAAQTDLVASEMRLTEAFVAGDVSPAVYRVKAADLRTKQVGLQLRIDRTAVDPDAQIGDIRNKLKMAASIWDVYQSLDDLQKAGFLRSVFESIVSGPEGIIGFSLKTPFDKLVLSDTLEPEKALRLAESLLDVA
jgi:site-specific DNA recombinase